MNKIYGFIGSLYSVAYRIQTEYSSHLKIAGKTNDEIEFVSGIDKNNEILFEILQKTINKISSNQIRDLIDKWAYTVYEKDIDYILLWQIILPSKTCSKPSFVFSTSIIFKFGYLFLK